MNEALTSNLDSSHIQDRYFANDAYGINGLTQTTFTIEMPFPSVHELKRHDKVQFIDFPENSFLCVEVHDRNHIPTDGILNTDTDIIAAFTGPTSSMESDYPNNGFFYGGKLYTQFMGANTRKGAIVISKKNTMRLVEDNVKEHIVKSCFNNILSMIGTSFYIKDTDSSDDPEITQYNGRSRLSYLLQYTRQDGSVKNTFVLATMGTRQKMKEWIDEYTTSVGIRSYIAVELERDQSDCFIKTPQGEVRSIGNGGFYNKPEHYVMRRRNANKS